MNSLILLLIILLALQIHQTSSGSFASHKEEYCIYEPFNAKCPGNGMIVMTSAMFGFMGKGRCIQQEQSMNCSINVLDYLDGTCSWKNSCNYYLGNLVKAHPCLQLIQPYLTVTYECLSVETSDTCSSSSTLEVSSRHGYISSAVASQTGCGNLQVPWVISLNEGHKVKIQLVSFRSKQDHAIIDTSCTPLGYIKNTATKTNTTICESPSMSHYSYTAEAKSITIQLLTDTPNNYLLEYEVTGCMDLVPPDFAWYQRSGDDAVIGCQYRNMTWSLHCDGYRWNGVVGRCNDTTVKVTKEDTEVRAEQGYQYLVLIGILAVFLIIIIICVTVGILKLIDRSKQREATKRQLLIDSSTTHGYASGNQMTMRPMYAERAEMVPDILESSLSRPHHMQYPPPESESSYGTNYPGTLYYMGAHNYSNMGPQTHQRDSIRDSRDYETVTLPKKPETVSDSESEDLYATIPPY